MRIVSTLVGRTVLLCLALSPLGAALAQTSIQQQEKSAVFNEQFSNFVANAAADPADSVCARQVAGSNVVSPPDLYSSNGVLTVNFNFNTAVDLQGLTRYCYIYASADGKTFYLAPTLRVNPGDQLVINFNNAIPAGTAATASAMPGMVMNAAAATTGSDCSATSVSSTSTNLHFHGLNVSPACHQDEVIHTIIQPQQSFTYTVQIPSNEPSGMYWYHPHPHGFSQGQVLGGATGAIIVEGIQNFNPAVAGLPERVIVLRDQALSSAEQSIAGNQPGDDLSINYVPVTYPNYVPANISTPVSTKEFWRVANTAANSLLQLQIVDNNIAQPMQIVAVDGVPITDGSGNPITATQTAITLPPGSRVEFIYVTPKQGDTAQLRTLTWNNGPDGDNDPGRPLANILASTATSDSGLPVADAVPASTAPAVTHTIVPAVTQSVPPLRFKALSSDAAQAVTTQRTLYFSVAPDFSAFYITVDGQTPTAFNMDAPPSIVVRSGTVEQWTIQNRSQMDHAFHIHQIHFRTVAINGSPVTDYTERDTINLPHWSGNSSDPYPSVTLLMDFTDPGIVGTFVYHCHILSHEDLGMMAAIQVVNAPTISTLSPNYGAPGTTVTITGANFGATQGSGTVTFSGIAATPSSWSNTSIVVQVPGKAPTGGSGSVIVTANGFASNAASFTYYPTPAITGISPASGATGNLVVITGTNLKDAQGKGFVTFYNGVAAPILVQSSTNLQVDVPAGAATGPIHLHANGIGINSSTFTVTAAGSAPQIGNLSSDYGARGATITITGTRFGATQGSSTVTFSGVKATPSSWSNTSIVVQVPGGAPTSGTGSLIVTVGGAASNAVPFTYYPAATITSISPASGAVGATVTITGTNLQDGQGNGFVTFYNGIGATILTQSNTAITVKVPSGATTGPIHLHSNGLGVNSSTFTVQ